jgi:hypothetical protein
VLVVLSFFFSCDDFVLPFYSLAIIVTLTTKWEEQSPEDIVAREKHQTNNPLANVTSCAICFPWVENNWNLSHKSIVQDCFIYLVQETAWFVVRWEAKSTTIP